MPPDETTPKLHVDTDWKAEAQAEKERLTAAEAAQSESREKGRTPDGGTLPNADFRALVGILASQALMGLGTMQDPQTKGIVIDFEGSRFSIDLLGVLEEKTKGNLTEEESTELVQLLAELRSRFVQINDLVARQAAVPGEAGTDGGTPPSPPIDLSPP